MLMRKIQVASGLFVVSIIAAGLVMSDRSVAARDSENTRLPVPTPSPADKKSFSEYRGLWIGTTTDDLRKKLGPPKDKSDAQDYYAFTENESAQFYYDDNHVVTAIMITYMGNLKDAPAAKDVFGEEVPPKPDGSVSKMVRYLKAGYWISYNRGGGSDALLSIAIQKM